MTVSELAAMRKEIEALRREVRMLRGEPGPQPAPQGARQKGPVRQRRAQEQAGRSAQGVSWVHGAPEAQGVQPVQMKRRARSQNGVSITMDRALRRGEYGQHGGQYAGQHGQYAGQYGQRAGEGEERPAQHGGQYAPHHAPQAPPQNPAPHRFRLTPQALGLANARGTVARPSVLVSNMPPELTYKVVRDSVFTHFSGDIVRVEARGNGTWVLKFRDIETANACAQKYNMAQVNKVPIRCVAMVQLEPRAFRFRRPAQKG